MFRNIKKEFPLIFLDWHPTLNGKVNPNTVKKSSRKKYWWKCHNKKCGCNWQATIHARINVGDVCPKCKERKKKRFTSDILEIKQIFKDIKRLQLQADKHLDIFINDDSVKAAKKLNAIAFKRKIDEINKLGLRLREIIVNYKKKMLDHKINAKNKNKKDE